MTLSRRSSSWVLLICCLVLVSSRASGVSARSTASNTSCEALRSWARSYVGTQPTPTLDELARFDRPHRIAIFTAITPETRSALWHEQIRRFAAREELTPSQRAFVDDALAKMTPHLYAQDRTTRAEVGRELRARGEKLFTRAQLAAWTDLAGPASGARPASAGTWERLTGPSTAAAQLPWCQCSTIDPWPECSAGCLSATCRWFGPGCGMGGFYDCDGNCA